MSNMIKYKVLICHILIALSISVSGVLIGQNQPVQNIQGRTHLSLNGRWNYIIDPYEMGYYDYRHEPFDQSASPTFHVVIPNC